ncbi:MAG: ribose-5-phosphate isomerase RpiA [Chloroflexi bacterium]|nr:ribose-5-phosphate isomerase RpiA [Chloroflexota bacterium]
MTIEVFKRQAGDYAAAMVKSDSVIGLGSGSTARYATLRIGERLRSGVIQNVMGVPTSEDTARLGREAGIPLTTLEEHPALDLTIDGADEVDPQWDVTKGLGGCLLREKVVAYATRFEIIVVDESKLVAHLGQRSPIPVEVLQFGWQNTLRGLEKTGARPVLRRQGDTPFVTDEGNWILDCHYASIPDAGVLGRQIKEIPGVVEHGLFLGMVHQVIVAGANGVRVLERK